MVNVNDDDESVASSVFSLVRSKTTSPVGSVFKTTSKVSVVPVSLTDVEPPDSVTVKPAVSLSVVVTLTV